jgi:hypothetical protein
VSTAPGRSEKHEEPATPADDRSAPEAQPAISPADVRLVRGQLETQELAAIAVVVSAMSVTSRLEAEERSLAEGTGHTSAWSDPVHCHPRAHGLRGQASPTAWQYADR